MFKREKILYRGNTDYGHYQIIDMVYDGRRARILFSGNKEAAFSGMPLDGKHFLLFDYIQRFFELVSHVRPKKLLMIGGGTYVLPMALVNALPDITVDVVEIDPGLDALAAEYFGYVPHERLNIIHAGGKDYLAGHTGRYDMVIVDAFTHLHIPPSLGDEKAAELIYQRLTSDGIVAINIISSYRGNNARVLRQFYDIYNRQFDHCGVYPADRGVSLWSSQNFLLISRKGDDMGTYGLSIPELTPEPNL